MRQGGTKATNALARRAPETGYFFNGNKTEDNGIMTIANWLGVIALALWCGIVIVFAVCALIDFTRGVEKGIGSLADEERERDEKEKGGAE